MSHDSGLGVSAVVVLAAGGGTRMRSKRSKVLHDLGGRPMLSYALSAAAALDPSHLVVVLGFQRDEVAHHVTQLVPSAVHAVQAEQRGVADAVRAGLAAVEGLSGDVLVTYGDVPLLTAETLSGLVVAHKASGNAVTVLAADESGDVESEPVVYVADAATLTGSLSAGDGGLLEWAETSGVSVGTHVVADHWQLRDVNDRVQLSEIAAELNRRILTGWMRAGVTVMDPATTWVADTVDLAEDVTLLPNTILRGATSIGEGATVGPDTLLTDVEVGPGAHVTRTHATLAVIGPDAEVGPYSFLRPGTRLGGHGKIGAFVEAKNAVIGEGAKVPHLTYCGDAEVGDGANIGAGTIFANYDGVTKSRTKVGKASFVGSNSVLVAPVEIADGAYVAAGSAITEAVEPGDLAIARGRQRNIPGWVASRRAGTKTEAAANEALRAKEGDKQ